MLLTEIFAFLELFADFSRRFSEGILPKLAEIGALLDEVRVVVDSVKDDMEESNGAACIFGVLLHEEEIFADFVLL